MTWDDFIARTPLVAILRGLTPDEAEPIGSALSDAGFVCAEVPLNSPNPLATIERLHARFDGRILIGAGTVLTEAEVERAAAAGAQFIVSPNTDTRVIIAAKRRGLRALPGFLSPSEAFAALEAGADALKLFPADHAGPNYIRAIRAVLPPAAPVLAVGGIDEALFKTYLAAGASGFGLGSSLYKPGVAPETVRARAGALIRAFREAAQ